MLSNQEMIMKKYDWRAFPCDLSQDAIIGLQRLAEKNAKGSDLTDIEYLNWQYLLNPAGKAIIWLAKDNNKKEVVGQVVFIPVKIKCNNEEVLGACAVNIITDVKYRNKGVFAILAQKALDEISSNGIRIVYGFPNEFAYPTWIKRTGFIDMGVIPDLIKVINIEKFVDKKFSNVIVKSILVVASKIIFFSKSKKIGHKWDIHEVHAFNQDFDLFWNNYSLQYGNAVIRRKEYLNWRYFECPLRQYKVFRVNFKGEMQAYIVLRIVSDQNMQVGWIIDLFPSISKNGQIAAEILISKAIEYFRSKKVDIIRTLIPRQSIGFRALRKNGFWRTPKFLKAWPIKIIINLFMGQKGGQGHLGEYYFTIGDNDAI